MAGAIHPQEAVVSAQSSTKPRRFGIPPATADQQVQKFHSFQSNQKFEPLPEPTGAFPYHLATSAIGIPPANGQRVFHVIGDTGGVKDPNPQLHVAEAMAADLQAGGEGPGRPAFCFHVGDVVYFCGAEREYGPQFYEPYAHYNAPILAIPGNHDGEENSEEPGVPSLSAFVENFCASTPHLDPQAGESNRDTMTEPNVYWTLQDELLSVVGMYTNVPEGGQVQQDQVEWLVGELKSAPTDRALLVALHHPPYSADAHHGGSARMGQLLDEAFQKSGRAPEMVLSGHVHNYQRFTRTIGGKQVPYLVVGAGGYHNLHKMAPEAGGGALQLPFEAAADCELNSFCDDQWGFLRLTVTPGQIAGSYTAVDKTGVVTKELDKFAT
ncbi:MAG TPA: metallophosphoesterase [Solirubrobacteraceae bacterium]|nr:metallophosphoesterase [Solirubrobacteraceae bacterium]